MREIIQIQVGKGGNKIGTKFWERINSEHGIDNNGAYYGNSDLDSNKLNVFYNERREGLYSPRAVLVDLESEGLEDIKLGKLRGLFRSRNFIIPAEYNSKGAGSWARGHYLEGADEMWRLEEVIRREAEESDNIQGLQMMHSLGGGTGSGMGTLLSDNLREEYPKKLLASFSIFLILVVVNVFHNNTYPIIVRNQPYIIIPHLKIGKDLFPNSPSCSPTYDDLNNLACTGISGATSSFRFRSTINESMGRISNNLVPFPRAHFLTIGESPMMRAEDANTPTPQSVVQEMLSGRNILCGTDPQHGKYLTASVIFRGAVKYEEIHREMVQVENNSSVYFTQYIPHGLSWGHTAPPLNSSNYPQSTLLANQTAVTGMLQRILLEFTALHKRKAFSFIYAQEGMDSMEFTEAQMITNDLIAQYEEYQNTS